MVEDDPFGMFQFFFFSLSVYWIFFGKLDFVGDKIFSFGCGRNRLTGLDFS